MTSRVVAITFLAALACALAPGTASAAACWQELVNDYWTDNRVDRTYPSVCYREAISKLPRDVQEYSDAQDELRRELLAAIRDERPTGGANRERRTAPPPPVEDGEAPSGVAGEAIERFAPKNGDTVPVQILVLAAIALVLASAAAGGFLKRYFQSRRDASPAA